MAAARVDFEDEREHLLEATPAREAGSSNNRGNCHPSQNLAAPDNFRYEAAQFLA